VLECWKEPAEMNEQVMGKEGGQRYVVNTLTYGSLVSRHLVSIHLLWQSAVSLEC